jgi:hypothetical protein
MVRLGAALAALLPLLALLQALSLAALLLAWLAARDEGASSSSAAAAGAVYGVALACAQGATSAALLTRLGAAATARDTAPLRGVVRDALVAWRLDAALRAQCGCGALLAPLWRASRAAVRAALARQLRAGGEGGGAALAAAAAKEAAWAFYARACAATCAAAAHRAALA